METPISDLAGENVRVSGEGQTSVDRQVAARAELLAAALRDIDTFDRTRFSEIRETTVNPASLASTPVPPTPLLSTAGLPPAELSPATLPIPIQVPDSIPVPTSAPTRGATPAPVVGASATQPTAAPDDFRANWRKLARDSQVKTAISAVPSITAIEVEQAIELSQETPAPWSPDPAASPDSGMVILPAPLTWDAPTPLSPTPLSPTPLSPNHAADLRHPASQPMATYAATGVHPSPGYLPTLPQVAVQSWPQPQPQQTVPQGFAAPVNGYAVPKRKANWGLRIVVGILVIVGLVAIAAIAATTLLQRQVQASFDSISMTLPGPDSPIAEGPAGVRIPGFDSSGFLIGDGVPLSGICGWNPQGSSEFRRVECNNPHNAVIVLSKELTTGDVVAVDIHNAECQAAATAVATSVTDEYVDLSFTNTSGTVHVCLLRMPSAGNG